MRFPVFAFLLLSPLFSPFADACMVKNIETVGGFCKSPKNQSRYAVDAEDRLLLCEKQRWRLLKENEPRMASVPTCSPVAAGRGLDGGEEATCRFVASLDTDDDCFSVWEKLADPKNLSGFCAGQQGYGLEILSTEGGMVQVKDGNNTCTFERVARLAVEHASCKFLLVDATDQLAARCEPMLRSLERRRELFCGLGLDDQAEVMIEDEAHLVKKDDEGLRLSAQNSPFWGCIFETIALSGANEDFCKLEVPKLSDTNTKLEFSVIDDEGVEKKLPCFKRGEKACRSLEYETFARQPCSSSLDGQPFSTWCAVDEETAYRVNQAFQDDEGNAWPVTATKLVKRNREWQAEQELSCGTWPDTEAAGGRSLGVGSNAHVCAQDLQSPSSVRVENQCVYDTECLSLDQKQDQAMLQKLKKSKCMSALPEEETKGVRALAEKSSTLSDFVSSLRQNSNKHREQLLSCFILNQRPPAGIIKKKADGSCYLAPKPLMEFALDLSNPIRFNWPKGPTVAKCPDEVESSFATTRCIASDNNSCPDFANCLGDKAGDVKSGKSAEIGGSSAK